MEKTSIEAARIIREGNESMGAPVQELAVEVSAVVENGHQIGETLKAVNKSELPAGVKGAFNKAADALKAAWNLSVAPTIALIGTVGQTAFNIIKGSTKAAFFPLLILGRLFVQLGKKALALVKRQEQLVIDKKALVKDIGILEDFKTAHPKAFLKSLEDLSHALSFKTASLQELQKGAEGLEAMTGALGS